MPGIYFDEAEIGLEIVHAVTRTVTEMDNTLFSCLTHNNQPLHLDAEYAKKTEFGQRLVNSMFTASLCVGVSVNDTTLGTLVANLCFNEMKFPKPVFIGDTLRTRTVIKEKRESKSRPNAGIITFEHQVWNQRDEMVCSIIRVALMQKRPAE
jgi:acyl dehydratase